MGTPARAVAWRGRSVDYAAPHERGVDDQLRARRTRARERHARAVCGPANGGAPPHDVHRPGERQHDHWDLYHAPDVGRNPDGPLERAAEVAATASTTALPRYRGRREYRLVRLGQAQVGAGPVQRVVDVAVDVFLAQFVIHPGALERDNRLGVYVG